MIDGLLSHERQVKCVLLGSSGVGKTTLFHRLLLNTAPFACIPTISPCVSTFYLRGAQILLWDTAGQEQYDAVTTVCLRDADICLAVFSLCDADSLSRAKEWTDRVLEQSPRCKIIAVGNKCDAGANCLALDTFADADAYVEVSSKTGANISTLIHALGDAVDGLLSLPEPDCAFVTPLPLSPDRKACC